MSLIEFQSISKSFFGAKALEQVSFGIDVGSTVGLIGENGAGKSTLMNI
ncbi:MAG: ATP-binding cassette domain-containing protein, partial [Calditrichaeota bacterium]